MKIKSSILFFTLTSLLGFVALHAVNNGGVWQTNELVSTVTGDNDYPQVAFDCNGNAICVWQNDQTNDTIYSARYNAATGAWGASESISTGLVGNNRNQQIAIDCSGNAICVWQYDDGGDADIYASYYDAAAGTWGTPVPISTGGGDFKSSQIAIDCNGNALVVWRDDDDNEIYSAGYNASTGIWGTSEVISTGDANSPQIAVDCNGNGICVWEDEGDDEIYTARYTASTNSWGTNELISTAAAFQEDPQIAIDCNGNAICVWFTSNFDIRAARYNAATRTWQVPEVISSVLAENNEPHIAFDCNGNAICVWLDDDSPDKIYAARYNAAIQTWAPDELISTATGNNVSPQVAIDCNGNAICVWDNNQDPIYSALFDAVPAPSNISSSQELHRYLTQGDLINVLCWDAVSFQNPIEKYRVHCTPYVAQTPCCEDCCDCKIRCCVCPCTNATLIGEISVSCPLMFRHHNRCYGQRTTYCLTAVDSAGNETPVPSHVTVPAV